MRRALKNVAKAALGLFAGLAVAEIAFLVRDGGAFAHLNFYEADPQLGARLEKNAHMRLSFGGNPATTVRTNDRGFRGGRWPEKKDGEVLVVGDSQVFGLGVEDEQTFSKQLKAALGKDAFVLNAGVPTYGPAEYTAVVEQLVPERKPRTVVYEARHALMFTLRAEQLDPEVAADPTQYLADFEHLFESLGEERFIAFVHVGEARGRRQLHIYRDELALRGDDKSRALFDAVVADEAHHEAYTGAILATLSTKPRAAIARARRWELWRAWLRAGRLVSAAVFTWTMRLLYLCLFPLALYEKRRAR